VQTVHEIRVDNEGAAVASEIGSAGSGAGRRWLGVEFRHLGALAAVAREGSFRRAAESLGYVQSAISSQIAQLERAVGSQLVERSSGSAGATLTPAGRVLLGHVDEILARFDAARVDLRALADARGAVVRLAVLEGIGRRRLPPILRTFVDSFPGGEIIIDEGYDDDRSFDRLASGEIDLMITELPVPSGPFDYALLERDAYVLLVSADSPLAGQPGAPTPDQLSRLPLILPAPVRRDDPVAAWLREGLVDHPPWLRPRTVAATQAMVGAGLGSAIVPRLGLDPDDDSTVAIELPSLLPQRSIALVRHRERQYSMPARGLIDIVEASFNVRPDEASS
jgi:DNA-binding transcriptional LysR family regulator